MKRLGKARLLAVLMGVALGAAGCFGSNPSNAGGGGTKAQTLVSGTVSAPQGTSIAASALRAQAVVQGVVVPGAAVTAYDFASGKQVGTTAVTDDQGNYSIELPDSVDDVVIVAVKQTKDGTLRLSTLVPDIKPKTKNTGGNMDAATSVAAEEWSKREGKGEHVTAAGFAAAITQAENVLDQLVQAGQKVDLHVGMGLIKADFGAGIDDGTDVGKVFKGSVDAVIPNLPVDLAPGRLMVQALRQAGISVTAGLQREADNQRKALAPIGAQLAALAVRLRLIGEVMDLTGAFKVNSTSQLMPGVVYAEDCTSFTLTPVSTFDNRSASEIEPCSAAGIGGAALVLTVALSPATAAAPIATLLFTAVQDPSLAWTASWGAPQLGGDVCSVVDVDPSFTLPCAAQSDVSFALADAGLNQLAQGPADFPGGDAYFPNETYSTQSRLTGHFDYDATSGALNFNGKLVTPTLIADGNFQSPAAVSQGDSLLANSTFTGRLDTESAYFSGTFSEQDLSRVEGGRLTFFSLPKASFNGTFDDHSGSTFTGELSLALPDAQNVNLLDDLPGGALAANGAVPAFTLSVAGDLRTPNSEPLSFKLDLDATQAKQVTTRFSLTDSGVQKVDGTLVATYVDPALQHVATVELDAANDEHVALHFVYQPGGTSSGTIVDVHGNRLGVLKTGELGVAEIDYQDGTIESLA